MWRRILTCLEHIANEDRWGLEMLWLSLDAHERRATFAGHGMALGLAVGTYTGGRPLAEIGVGALAQACWSLNGWAQVSEADFFAALYPLAHPEGTSGLNAHHGYLYSLILDSVLRLSGDGPTLLIELARDLVSR